MVENFQCHGKKLGIKDYEAGMKKGWQEGYK